MTLRRIDLDRGERAVLRDVNWRIQPGQRWLLVGGNGAGKTQLAEASRGQRVAQAHGPRIASLSMAGENFDMPAGVSEEIAYVGAERQDRYEHYEWNFRAREVVGTGVQRTDIPMRELDAARNPARRLIVATPGNKRAGRTPFPHAFLWRAAAGAHRARTRQPAQVAAAR